MNAPQDLDLRSAKPDFKPRLPIDLNNLEVIKNMDQVYDWLLEHEPVAKGKASILRGYFVSRYDDCLKVLKDHERFTRVRGKPKGKSGGGGYMVPKSMRHLVSSIVNTDDPEHRRLRDLVHRAFTPRSLDYLGGRIEELTHELIDSMGSKQEVDLIKAYTHPIPVQVIADMMGVDRSEMPVFENGLSVLTEGLSGWSLLRTILWDLPKLDKFVRHLIAKKREALGEDILSGLITAEVDGDRLTEDELVAMTFILILAGFETTVYMIANTALMLLLHPEQRALALSSAENFDKAIEESLRFHGSVTASEAHYTMEDVTLSGVTLPKGSTVFALFAAANRDPRVFDRPEIFDITRTPNKHLGFGQGIHYCVGAPLARIEARIALKTLFERAPNLELAVSPERLEMQKVPFFRRYASLPVRLSP